MYRKILSLILVMTLLLTSCSNHKTNSDNNGIDKGENNIVRDDKFELTALKSDNQGIDKNTGFQLSSKEKIDKSFINNNLEIIPDREYKIEEVTKTVYNILPLTSLENDKVYQVKLKDEEYVYSWAFQTNKKFEVESTIPANYSSYVPVNSGIEMYFTLNGFDKIDDFFEITPKVEGKFIYNNNSVIFVPVELESNINYTVKIKKGFSLQDGAQKLEEDYIFSFNTNTENKPQIHFESFLTNIYEGNPKVIQGYVDNSDKEAEYNINIFQYKDTNEFAKDIKNYADTGKISEAPENKSNIIKINTIKQKPYIKDRSYMMNAFFQLPELTKGYYLLEFNNADDSLKKTYHFIQINDMLLYDALFEDKILIFTADCKTGQGIKGAKITLNNEAIGTTDGSGILISDKLQNVKNEKSIYMKVEAKGYNDFIYATGRDYGFGYEEIYNSNKYMQYLDTDRPVYLPTDKINVWGYARYADNKAIKKVKIELVENYTDLVLESKYVDLTKIGTYQTAFEIKSITSQSCRINVYDNERLISVKYIDICEYTKPLYKLSGKVDKEYVYAGEKVNYTINGNFFDGSPAPNMELNYSSFHYGNGSFTEYNQIDKKVTLNEAGESIINVNTDLKSDNWRPVSVIMESRNNGAEDKTISTRNSIQIFPKHTMLEIEQNDVTKPQNFDVLLHELDLAKYKEKEYWEDKDLRGKPLEGSIHIEITEYYHEKQKVGEHYDFINKINVIDYNYSKIESKIYTENLNTVNGIVNVQIPNYRDDRNYTVIAYYDGDGGITEQSFLGSNRYYYQKLYYTIEKADKKEKYRINDTVKLKLDYNHEKAENAENDKLLILMMRNGLIDYKITDNTELQFEFKEDYLSNVMVNGIYIKNGYIYPVYYYNDLYYDRSERQIYFDISTDKEKYRPGEEVELKIKAKDENNKPCIADVNISVVDEAYFAVFEKNVRTLEQLYYTTGSTGLLGSYISNIDLSKNLDGGAEKGGGGGYDGYFRDEFKDTNVFKTLTTDKNGNASMKFKLADNLTSWRITYQAISDKKYAGSGTKNVTVSLPFYADLIMGKEYLKEDKISASLRVFGSEVISSEPVNYKVKIKDKATGKETEYNQTGEAGKYTNIFFDKLKEGQYEIYVYASQKNNKDGIKEEFKVVDSAIYFNNTDYYQLTDSTVLEKVYSNPIITLFNESKSDFYNSLSKISSSGGKRADQTLCSMIATKYINEYFDANLDYDEEELLQLVRSYESQEGGIRLLPYSAEDTELTAKLINMIDNKYLNTKAKIYFNNLIKNTDTYNTKIAASLWGVSKYKEPVLLTIYKLLEENNNLGERDKLYLSLALAELGDNNTAKKYYKELIKNNLKEDGEYLYFDSKTNETDSYELTALLSVLGVKLQDYENSDKLFKYIYNKPSKYTLSNLEQLIYIMNRDIMKLDEIKDLFGEVTVAADGVNRTYKLKLFDRESFAIEKEKIKAVKFSNIKGSIACKVEALGNKDDLDKNKTEDFSLSVSYSLNGASKEQKEYKHSDVVKVTIMPSFSSDIDKLHYEITYIIPSGFRYIDTYKDSMGWADVNGQKLKFDCYYDRKHSVTPIVFFMQAAQKGTYTVDYAVIKEQMENKLNYINKSSLTVR